MLPISGSSRRGVRWLAACLLLGLGLRTIACCAWSHQLGEDRDLYVLLARQLASGRGYSRPWRLQYDSTEVASTPPENLEPAPDPDRPEATAPTPAPSRADSPDPTSGATRAVPPRFGLGVPVLSPAEGGGGPAWEFTPRREREFPRPDSRGLIDLPTAYRPPLYPLLLALALKGRDSPVTIAILNLLLGVGTLVALGLAAARVGRAVGSPVAMPLLAVGLVACDPLLVAQAPLAMTETLAACLVSGLLAVVAFPSTLRSSLLAGVLLGLLALCRPTFLASAAVWGGLACMAAMRRRAAEGGGPVPLRALLALCGGLAVVLLPWGIRNQRQFGHPMVTTSHGGYTLRLAQNPRYAGLVALTSDPAGWRAYNQVLADEGYAWMFSPERSKGTVGLSRSTAGRLAYSGPIDHWEIDSDAALQRLAVQHLGQSPSLAWATARSLLGRLWSPWPRQADSWPAVARWALGSEQLLLFAAAAAGLSIWSWSAGWRGVGPGRIGMPSAVEPIPRQAIPGGATPVDERHFESTTEGRARAEVAAVSAVGRLAVALLLSFTLVHSVYWADMRMRAPLVPVLALLAARAGVALLEKRRRPRGGGQPG